jgi:hypothetical protein
VRFVVTKSLSVCLIIGCFTASGNDGASSNTARVEPIKITGEELQVRGFKKSSNGVYDIDAIRLGDLIALAACD